MPSDEEISDAVEVFIDETLGGDRRGQALDHYSPAPADVRRNVPGRPIDVRLRFEPPLARLWCNKCHNHWDAWIDDAGKMEDRRDGRCSCGGTVFLTVDE